MKYLRLVLLTFCLNAILWGCGDTSIKISSSSSDYVGVNYEVVIEDLQKVGFENIETEIIEDLTSTSSMSDGAVEKVVIDDKADFEKKDSFSCDAKVKIIYHVIRKVMSPISSDSVQEIDYESISKVFKNAGFINVTTAEVYDLDPDSTEAEYVNKVTINGKSTFNEMDEFPYDADVSIICSRPYEKYTVQLYVDCIGNLLFSKYDIDVLINDEKKEFLPHGEEAQYEFRLKEGEYTFTFAEAGSSSVKGVETVEVLSDMEISYELYCSADKVSIETIYIDRKTELSGDEVKVEVAASDYKYKNYKEIIASLEASGFTNIKTEIMYDIIWGITPEGESDKVTIDGKSDFKKGEVFAKDVEIIVTYHMLEEDNPTKQLVEIESKEDRQPENDAIIEEEQVLTADNCEDLVELLNSEDYEVAKSFASKYKGRKIEFDGYVADIAHYSDRDKVYNTRFNYLIYIGDNGQEYLTGPCIQFKDVSYYDFHLTGDKPDSISRGMNLHIIAEVKEFNHEQGLLILDPVLTNVR